MIDPQRAGVTANLVLIRGTLPHEAQHRELPSGAVVVQFDVTTVIDGSSSTVSVPIAWHEPSAAQAALLVGGLDVLVMGTVRRRFFRVGGATQSRTEVVADAVIPTRRRKQIADVLRHSAERLLADVA